MTSGKVKTLFSDKEKTEALFPRTKTSAISNEDGIGLDALMENLIYSSNENLNQDTVPLNADTLGGYPAEDYASKLYVKEQILKVQEGTGVDLSEFATKEDLSALTADDVGALPISGGTMAGNVDMNGNNIANVANLSFNGEDSIVYLGQDTSGKRLRLYSGANASYNGGASLRLHQKDYSGAEGIFVLTAHDGTNSKALDGNPDGTLTWGGNEIFDESDVISIINGGTGATTASEALFNLSERDVTSNANLCLDSGHYYTNTETLNIPYSTYGFLYVVRTKVNWTIQTWHNINDGIVYTRSSTDGGSSFSSWDTGTGTNKVFNKLTDIGITTFPTTMKTVAASMPNNSTLMLDSRDVLSGGTHEISDLGNTTAGMYMFMKGNSSARFSLLNIYSSTSAGTSHLNYGCYAASTDEVTWVLGERQNSTYPDCRYRIAADGEREWINTPMLVGTEYRTTERYMGKIVYAKLVNFGALPNDTTKQVGFCSDGCTNVVSITAILDNGCVIHGGTGKDLNMGQSYNITLNCTKYNIRILTDYDFSSRSAYVLVKYTLD